MIKNILILIVLVLVGYLHVVGQELFKYNPDVFGPTGLKSTSVLTPYLPNGGCFTPKGSIKVLIIFASFGGTYDQQAVDFHRCHTFFGDDIGYAENRIHDNAGVTSTMLNKAFELISPDNVAIEDLTLSNRSKQYEAGNSITLENVTVQNNSTLFLRAGQSITLERNVTINSGCKFEAKTQSFCQ